MIMLAIVIFSEAGKAFDKEDDNKLHFWVAVPTSLVRGWGAIRAL